ncbi:MAG: two-component system, OmpR family, response regulator PrrA [Pseudonocardiales bacterium]|jgi:DNA-binding response OmpR family regulator|nr:two-component system, OmpR family, response regulator PrrA [Pseudonocardiales bacterium]
MSSTTTATLDRPLDAPGHRRHVLLVEDTESVRRAVSLGLRTSGFDVTAVAGGAEALAAYAAVRPSVVLTDLSMPGMDGLELVRTLRVRQVEVPILMMSARDSAQERAAALAAGGDGFLAKPFGLTELRDRVTALAESPPHRCGTLAT